ncbi:MAG TPA: hypothetical protein VK802_01485 [Streptosporangiaceae bacterium]|jgi:hypothetical protein|nr:hypothetical protein [Streptosporangiaceae bacterium]
MTDPTEPAQEVPEAGASAPPDSAPAESALPESALPESALPDSALPESESAVPAGTTAPRRRRRGGLVAVIALIVLGLVGVLGGGAALGKELTRKATKAEQAAALAAEIASRWQRLPAGKIFPATVTYFNAEGDHATAALAGIVPETSCRQALEPSAFQRMHALSCAAMLRATYLDAAGTQAATVGIAVMASPAAAQRVQSGLDPMKAGSGLYAVAVGGTLADTFGNAQRGADGAEIAGPYLMLFTAGYADGIPGSDVTTNDELVALGSGVLAAVQKNLTSHTSPCEMKDIKC